MKPARSSGNHLVSSRLRSVHCHCTKISLANPGPSRELMTKCTKYAQRHSSDSRLHLGVAVWQNFNFTLFVTLHSIDLLTLFTGCTCHSSLSISWAVDFAARISQPLAVCRCLGFYIFFLSFSLSFVTQVNLEQESRTKLLKLLGYNKEDLQKKVRVSFNTEKPLQD